MRGRVAGIAALLAACGQVEQTPRQYKEQFQQIPLWQQERDVDVLFVIDNSGSMDAEQQSLQANFYRFIDRLASFEGGLPNLHIAVISTDLGDGGHGCNSNDSGRFQSSPRTGCTVSPPAWSFIVDVELDGGRQRNYPDGQSLADTFACIARLGTTGCGFEQPLQSMRHALDGSNPSNAGFLRDDAYLAIIFITDEDDCSAEDTELFRVAAPDDPLGPRHSFRCWEHGVRCEPDEPRTRGAKENCIPRPDSQLMYDVGEFINFVHELKDDPDKIIVAGIMGEPEPVIVKLDGGGNLDLEKSCPDLPLSPSDGAVPATRLQGFLDGFRYSRRTSLCDSDLSGALQSIADLFAQVLAAGSPSCLVGALLDTDANTPGVQPNCQVSQVTHPHADHQIETVMPACDTPADPEASTNKPCYAIRDADICSEHETGLGIGVFRTQDNVPPRHLLVAAMRGRVAAQAPGQKLAQTGMPTPKVQQVSARSGQSVGAWQTMAGQSVAGAQAEPAPPPRVLQHVAPAVQSSGPSQAMGMPAHVPGDVHEASPPGPPRMQHTSGAVHDASPHATPSPPLLAASGVAGAASTEVGSASEVASGGGPGAASGATAAPSLPLP